MHILYFIECPFWEKHSLDHLKKGISAKLADNGQLNPKHTILASAQKPLETTKKQNQLGPEPKISNLSRT